MRTGIKLLGICILVLSFILIVLSLLAYTPGTHYKYTVTPGSGSPSLNYLSGASKDAPIVSFWQLPLWVQVAGVLDSILILGGMLYSAPFVIGKVQDVLKNRNRLSVFNYVSSNPGCTPIEISVRQNMNKGTVKYHVFMLESQGKIILRRAGRYIRLFNSSQANSELVKTVLSYVKNDTSKGLLYAIMEEPGVTNKKLSEKFSLDKSSVHWHIERFINDRLVKFEQEGKNKRYFLEPDVIRVLSNFSSLGT